MAVLTTQAREDLSKKQFALPKQEGYPIQDLAHARNALARVSQHGTPSERATVRRKVYSKYPALKENFQEREGESPVSKENIKKEKLGAYEQGYLNTLQKLGFEVANDPEEILLRTGAGAGWGGLLSLPFAYGLAKQYGLKGGAQAIPIGMTLGGIGGLMNALTEKERNRWLFPFA